MRLTLLLVCVGAVSCGEGGALRAGGPADLGARGRDARPWGGDAGPGGPDAGDQDAQVPSDAAEPPDTGSRRYDAQISRAVDASVDGDAALADAALADAALADAALADAARPGADAGSLGPPLGRGLRWVRHNEMFLSALTVRMPPPPVEVVRAYFEDFHATAVQLWEWGVPGRMNAWRAARPGARWLAWLRADGTSGDGGALLGGYGANEPGRVGWQIGDEPRTPEAFEALVAGLRAVRAADPEGLVVLNFTFEAGDALPAMIDRFVDALDGDVISYDRYSRGRSAWQTIMLFRAAGLRHGVPYWRYLNSYVAGGHEAWGVSDTRWDAFVGLLCGYTGHSWFVYQVDSPPAEGLRPALFDQPGDWAAGPSPLFATVADLNERMLNYGRAVTQMTSVDVRYVPGVPGLPPRGVEEWRPGAGGDPYLTGLAPVDNMPLQELAVGYFEDDGGDRYLMIQNQSHSGGAFPNANDHATGVELRFDFGGAPAGLSRDQVQVLRADTGRVEPLALAGEGGGRALRVQLEAGAAILLKYDTGRPFAGY